MVFIYDLYDLNDDVIWNAPLQFNPKSSISRLSRNSIKGTQVHSTTSLSEQAMSIKSISSQEKKIIGEKVLIAANSIQLVMILTTSLGTIIFYYLDFNFMNEFFYTFREFLTPIQFLRLILVRYAWSLVDNKEKRMLVRVRLFVIIRHWINNFYLIDFKNSLQMRTLLSTGLKEVSLIIENGETDKFTDRDKRILKELNQLLYKFTPKDSHIVEYWGCSLPPSSATPSIRSRSSLNFNGSIISQENTESSITNISSLTNKSVIEKTPLNSIQENNVNDNKPIKDKEISRNNSSKFKKKASNKINEFDLLPSKSYAALTAPKLVIKDKNKNHSSWKKLKNIFGEKSIYNEETIKPKESSTNISLTMSNSTLISKKSPETKNKDSVKLSSLDSEYLINNKFLTGLPSKKVGKGKVDDVKGIKMGSLEEFSDISHKKTPSKMGLADLFPIHSIETEISSSKINILEYRSEIIAHQFTLLDAECVSGIEWTILLNSNCLNNKSPIFNALSKGIKRFNKIHDWTLDSIINNNNKEEVNKNVSKILRIANKCYGKNNFFSLTSILLALQSHRLCHENKGPENWNLNSGDLAIWENLKSLVDPTSNWKSLRAVMSKFEEINHTSSDSNNFNNDDIVNAVKVELDNSIAKSFKKVFTSISHEDNDIVSAVPFLGLFIADLLHLNELPTKHKDKIDTRANSIKTASSHSIQQTIKEEGSNSIFNANLEDPLFDLFPDPPIRGTSNVEKEAYFESEKIIRAHEYKEILFKDLTYINWNKFRAVYLVLNRFITFSKLSKNSRSASCTHYDSLSKKSKKRLEEACRKL